MPQRRLVFRPDLRHAGERLDRFLTAALAATEEAVSRRRVRRLIADLREGAA